MLCCRHAVQWCLSFFIHKHQGLCMVSNKEHAVRRCISSSSVRPQRLLHVVLQAARCDTVCVSLGFECMSLCACIQRERKRARQTLGPLPHRPQRRTPGQRGTRHATAAPWPGQHHRRRTHGTAPAAEPLRRQKKRQEGEEKRAHAPRPGAARHRPPALSSWERMYGSHDRKKQLLTPENQACDTWNYMVGGSLSQPGEPGMSSGIFFIGSHGRQVRIFVRLRSACHPVFGLSWTWREAGEWAPGRGDLWCPPF